MFTLPDGRLKISFEHPNGYAADVTIRARRAATLRREAPVTIERAFDFSKTLYDVQLAPPRIIVTREYLETTPGEEANLHRPTGVGDEFTVVDVDTGQPLATSRRGDQTIAKLATPIAGADASARLRITGPMTGVDLGTGDDLQFGLSIDVARAVVLLPPSWDVASVSVPATVSTQPDGRVAIQIFNASAGALPVTIRAAKR